MQSSPHILSISFFFFSSRRRHTRLSGDWSSDVCLPIFNGDDGALVAAHCVKGYTSSHTCLPIGSGRRDFLPLHNLPAPIIATSGTGTMRQLPLMAVGALTKRRRGEGVMGAPFSCPGIAVTTFRKGHRSSSWSSVG